MVRMLDAKATHGRLPDLPSNSGSNPEEGTEMFDKLMDESVGLPQMQHLLKDWSGGIIIFVVLLMGGGLLLRPSECGAARQAGVERDLLPKDAIANMLTTSFYNLTLRTIGAGVML